MEIVKNDLINASTKNDFLKDGILDKRSKGSFSKAEKSTESKISQKLSLKNVLKKK